jgi:hypothetical protein
MSYRGGSSDFAIVEKKWIHHILNRGLEILSKRSC